MCKEGENMMRKNGLKQRLFSIVLAASLAVSSVYVAPAVQVQAEKGEGTVYAKRKFDSNYDTQNAYYGDDLGCTYTKEKTTFKVWTPEATSVVLCRYKEGNGGSVLEELPMTKGDKGVWSVTVNGDIVNTYYTYKVTVNGTTNEAVDIYAKAVGVNGDRAMVVDLDSTDPENWDTNYKREKTLVSDIIVWEIHIRDFSIDVSSGVSEENRGKYKAFTEDTTVNGEGKVASCVNYLKQLGVTHVQLMPTYDYASVDETNVSTSLSDNYNWGYDPENFNVPEGSYSSNPYDGNVRITEMKEMIQALHDAGIKVVMDVVYNHTYDTADSNFNKIMPDYYYKINDDMSYNNQAGCGNATRSSSAMYRKFMLESVCYWAEEYNLDGFRFDLMGILDRETMNQIRQTLDEKFGEDNIVLYGEGWTAEGHDSDSAYKSYEAQLDDGIGYFNDQIRDALKGNHDSDTGTIGLLQTNYFSGSYLEPGAKWPNNVYGGIMGSVGFTPGEWGEWRPFWSKSSNCVVSYNSAHDNLTLWDKLAEGVNKQYDTTDERLIKMNKMSGAIVLSSKGGSFMQAGEEFARTKYGDHNSYKSPDSVNKIDWNRVEKYSAIQQYYEGMIKIRKAFSGFRSITTRSSDNWNPNNNNMTWITDVKDKQPTGLFGFYETNNVAGEWNKIAVLINNATTEQTATLNENAWVIIADGTKAGLERIKETGSTVTVPAKSVVVAVPKATFDACNISENKAPVITADSNHQVAVGTPLSFQIKTSDPDGDTVTLSAEGVPTGATLDVATGNFTWTNPTAGTYTITVKATDGKATTQKTITITVTEKTTALKELVKEIETANLKEQNFTQTVWTPFATALEEANTIIANSATDDAVIQTALEKLQESYAEVKKEKAAKEAVEEKITQGKEKVKKATADSENYDAEAVADLETVIAETEEAISEPKSAEAYDSIAEDLQAANDAVVSLKTNPVIRVKAEKWATPAVYVWTGTGNSAVKYAGDWPGTKLTTKDAEGWYVFELPEGLTGYSVIVNDGAAGTGTQTSDIAGIAESVDVTVTSFSGDSCKFEKQEQPLGTGTVEVSKTQLDAVLAEAEKIPEKGVYMPNPLYQQALSKALQVKSDATATQVQVNQAVRNLKKAMDTIIYMGDVTIIPTQTPSPTAQVSPTAAVTGVPTEAPSITPTIKPTETPIEHKVMSFSFDGNEIKVAMEDNATANSFLEAMPMGMYFEDYMGQGKMAYVEAELDAGVVPESYRPTAGTLAYHTSWGNICFFYEDGEESSELIPIGKVISGMEAVKELDKAEIVNASLTGEVVTPIPTLTPSAKPTETVTGVPTQIVTQAPTLTPTSAPIETPTQEPTKVPTKVPTSVPKPTVTKTPAKTEKFTLKVSSATTTSAKLEWNMLSSADAYQVYRATSAKGSYKLVTTINDGTKTTFTNKSLQCGKTYYYYVKAYEKQSGNLVCINTTATQKIKVIPAKVSLKSAKASAKKVKITWKKQSGINGYVVYQSTKKNSGYKNIATVKSASKVSYTTKTLKKGKKFYYKVRAYKTVNGKKVYGDYSNVKSVTVK